MKCPYCGYKESKVIDSRPAEEGSSIRRRRECLSCAKRFTTYEVIETVPVIVIKKDKSREVFDRNKLINGLLRACANRPISIAAIEKMVDDIEAKLQNSLDREVSSTLIGEYAMEACGRVVTKDVPPHALVAGNPAKQIGWVCVCGNRLDASGQCTVCGRHPLAEET